MLRQHSRLLEFLIGLPLTRRAKVWQILLVFAYRGIPLASLELYAVTFYSLLIYSFVAHKVKRSSDLGMNIPNLGFRLPMRIGAIHVAK